MQLASSCQRWNNLPKQKDQKRSNCFGVIAELMHRDEDAKDPVIPLMTWLALEPNVGVTTLSGFIDYPEFLITQGGMASEEHILIRHEMVPRILRLWASNEDPGWVDHAVRFSYFAQVPKAAELYIDGLLEGLRGRRLKMTDDWKSTRSQLKHQFKNHPGVLRRMHRIGIHFGDEEAVAAMEHEALDTKLDLGRRIEAIQDLSLARLPGSVNALIDLATSNSSPEIKREALRALSVFDSDRVPSAFLAQWPKLPADLRTEVVGLLSSRKGWAKAMVDGMTKGTPAKQDLTENDVRRILKLGDDELAKKVEKVWGKLRAQTPEKVEALLEKFRKQLAEMPADRKAGLAVFEKNCMVCHKLNGKGHEVGPDLTGANRKDVEYLLVNIIDPNRVVGKDYYTATVVDKSGRSLSGLLAEDTPQRVVLKGENAKLTVIPRGDIDAFQLEERSLMPEGLPEKMTEKDFRDLMAFLLEEPYLTRGLIAGPFKMALDFAGPIEKAADPLKADGVKWKPFELGPAGTIDMEKLGVLAPPTDSTAYVYFDLAAPRPMKAELVLAAKEDVKVWLNGKEVYKRNWAVEPRRLAVELKEGTNQLLIKVHNIYGPSWLRPRIADPERVVELRALKGK
jgi:putative heme-binding domain-containing protein